VSRDRRRKGGFWNLVVDDPYRKLVAIGLAILMWFFIDSRIMDSAVYVLSLEAVDERDLSSGDDDRLSVALPTDRVVKRRFLDGDREIQNVRVTVSGPRFRIDALKEERLNLAVMTFLNREWSRGEGPDVQTVEFTAENIRRDVRVLDEIAIVMDPPRVRLEVGIEDNLVFPVQNEQVQFLAEGFESQLLLDTAQFTPASVKIIGPARSIQKLSEQVKAGQQVLRVELDRDGDEASGELTIIDGPDLLVKFQQTPSVRVELEPTRKDFTFELPVVVDDLNLKAEDRGRFVPDEPRIGQRISFSGRLLVDVDLIETDAERQKWAEDNLRLVVHLDRPEDGNRFGEVISRPIYLVPIGPLLERADSSEYKIGETRNVTLRRK